VGNGAVLTGVLDVHAAAVSACPRVHRAVDLAFARLAHDHWLPIDPTELLRVTAGHLDDLGTDLDQLAAPVLPSAAARLANGQRDLIVGPSFFRRTAEDLARQEQQGGIVIERGTGISTDLRHRLSISGIRFGRNFKAQHVPT